MGKSANEKLTIGIRVSKEEKDCFEGLAKARGCTITDIMRSAVKRTYEEIQKPASAPVVSQNDGRVLALLDEILAAVKGKAEQPEARATADILDIAIKAPTFAEEPVSAQDEMPVVALAEATRVPVLDDKGRVKLKPVGFEISNRLKGMGAVDSRLGYLVVPQEIDAEPFKEFFA
jgi:uncharacterized protein (DUF1778 family)